MKLTDAASEFVFNMINSVLICVVLLFCTTSLV